MTQESDGSFSLPLARPQGIEQSELPSDFFVLLLGQKSLRFGVILPQINRNQLNSGEIRQAIGFGIWDVTELHTGHPSCGGERQSSGPVAVPESVSAAEVRAQRQ